MKSIHTDCDTLLAHRQHKDIVSPCLLPDVQNWILLDNFLYIMSNQPESDKTMSPNDANDTAPSFSTQIGGAVVAFVVVIMIISAMAWILFRGRQAPRCLHVERRSKSRTASSYGPGAAARFEGQRERSNKHETEEQPSAGQDLEEGGVRAFGRRAC